MAGYPAPLFVAVGPAGRGGERLDKKLQRYFQSKQSGGGECDVKAEDVERGVYRVQFQSEEERDSDNLIKTLTEDTLALSVSCNGIVDQTRINNTYVMVKVITRFGDKKQYFLVLFMKKSEKKAAHGFLAFLLDKDNLLLMSFLADVLAVFSRYQKQLQDGVTILDIGKLTLLVKSTLLKLKEQHLLANLEAVRKLLGTDLSLVELLLENDEIPQLENTEETHKMALSHLVHFLALSEEYRNVTILMTPKRRVQASEYHSVTSHNQTLSIRILQDSEVTRSAEKPFSQSLTSQATRPSLSISSIQRVQNSFEKMQLSEKYTDNPLTKKIFLSVTATLNTCLFTREERAKAVNLCPTLKTEKWSNELGVEKVTGDYGDIEELHHHFKKLLEKSYHSGESTNPQEQNDLEGMTMNNQKEGSEADSEESSDMKVPSAIFEYFSHVCKGEAEDLEKRFNIKLTSVEDGGGMTSVRFASAGSSSCIEKAQQTFVTSFQKVAADLKQEIIPLADIHQVIKTSEKLNTNFKSILVKPQGNTLTLRGPARDLSAAKDFVKQMEEESLPKKPEVNFLKTGILVDTDVFEFLEPKLATEIQSIKQMYGTLMEKKKCLSSQNTHIIFKPETKKKSPDPTSKAYERFFSAYQKALKAHTAKIIPLKHLLDQGGNINEFFHHLQTENSKVLLKKKEDKLTIFGLPEHVHSTEKHLLQFLNTGLPALHSGKAGMSSGASLEYNSDRKGYSSPSGDLSYVKAAKAEPEEEECSICMDKINQKEVLPKCKHAFCRGCIQMAMKYKPVCPVCNMSYGKIEGNQPPGKMDISKTRISLPGYEGSGTITITYHIPDGTQNVSLSKIVVSLPH
ncbi:UNVERIFIED_CONTAM: hypothetical protein K2H54_023125 [Gekko kuhli]